MSINKEELLLQLERAGQLHGHICPSLFYGVSLAMRIKEWLEKNHLLPSQIILEGKSQCIRDGVRSTLGEHTPFSVHTTSDCALAVLCSHEHKYRVRITPSVRTYLNKLNQLLPLKEFQSEGVDYLKSLPENEFLEEKVI